MYYVIRGNYDIESWYKRKNDAEIKYNKKLHRKLGPALITKTGSELWYEYGLEYRFSTTWFENFEFCNEIYRVNENKLIEESFFDFPAISYNNGMKIWMFNGVPHREEQPAIIYPNGDEEWWFFNTRHRENGPAVTFGNKQYWFHFGKFIKCIH
jgi:hypothetical protein